MDWFIWETAGGKGGEIFHRCFTSNNVRGRCLYNTHITLDIIDPRLECILVLMNGNVIRTLSNQTHKLYTRLCVSQIPMNLNMYPHHHY